MLADVIAARVRMARGEAHLSQGEMGQRSGLSQSKLSDIEKGIGRVAVDDLIAIAHAVDKPLLWFLGEDNTPTQAVIPASVLDELLLAVANLKAKYSR